MNRRPPFSRFPFDYDWDYPHRPGQPHGDSYPPPDLTDQAQWAGLDPAQGDEYVSRRMLNHPWGKQALLTAGGPSLTFIQTDVAFRPTPIAVQARFALFDSAVYTPDIPGAWTGTLRIKVIRSLSIKSGPMTETFDLTPGDTLPFCVLIARGLTITAELQGENPLGLNVALVAAPVDQIDCADLVGPTPQPLPAGFTDTVVQRFAANATVNNFAAEPKRATLIIVNMSATNLFIKLGTPNADPTPGTENATIVLPGGVFSGFSQDNYQGEISMVYADATDEATGYALVTQGLWP